MIESFIVTPSCHLYTLYLEILTIDNSRDAISQAGESGISDSHRALHHTANGLVKTSKPQTILGSDHLRVMMDHGWIQARVVPLRPSFQANQTQ